MMAPDPPREDRHQEHRDVDEIDGDDETLQPGTFVVDWSAIGEGDVGEGGDDDDDDELMFVPQGPHELDMGSGSEYSSDDDDEDDNNGDQARNNLAEEGASSEHSRGNLSSSSSSSARGHYQMLIPFPPSQMLESSDGEDIINGTVVEGIAAPARVIISGAVSEERDGLDNANNSAAISAANSQSSEIKEEPKETAPRREITLTEEKVETIKSVMQNFTLPPPPWASECDEDTWKKRLAECIDSKSKSSKDS